MSKDRELLPCPFCGGSPAVDNSYEIGPYIGCEACDYWIVDISLWNARARLAEPQGDAGSLWSTVRSILAQGTDIHKDYMAGNHGDYEAYSARLDAAARERADELLAALRAEGAPAFAVSDHIRDDIDQLDDDEDRHHEH